MICFFRKNGLNIKCKSISGPYFRLFNSKTPPWSVLFFGTDDFSLYSCKSLHQELLKGKIIKKLEIVTSMKNQPNVIRNYAKNNKLIVHSWPFVVPENYFDVGLVVSFGHLIPENVINAFPYGMLNIHASLLPRWRGAAPIIYALANGDTKTGVTVMRIRPNHFDVGEIIHQEQISVNNDTKMPELHGQLGSLGADSLIKVLSNLTEYLENARPQPNEGVTLAPKITPDFAVINFSVMSSSQIYNLSRAIEGYLNPTSTWNNTPVKFFDIEICDISNNNSESVLEPGFVKYDKKTKNVRIFCANRTCIRVGKLSVYGKKVMSALDFNNGYIKKEPVENRFFK